MSVQLWDVLDVLCQAQPKALPCRARCRLVCTARPLRDYGATSGQLWKSVTGVALSSIAQEESFLRWLAACKGRLLRLDLEVHAHLLSRLVAVLAGAPLRMLAIRVQGGYYGSGPPSSTAWLAALDLPQLQELRSSGVQVTAQLAHLRSLTRATFRGGACTLPAPGGEGGSAAPAQQPLADSCVPPSLLELELGYASTSGTTLGTALGAATGLRRLALTEYGHQRRGAANPTSPFSSGLERFPHLTHLKLGRLESPGAGEQALASIEHLQQLQELYLPDLSIPVGSWGGLARLPPSVTLLDMSSARCVPAELSGLTHIKNLNLSQHQYSAQRHLAPLWGLGASLTSLDLTASCRLELPPPLSTFTGLRRLVLRGCPGVGRNSQALGHLGQLTYLDLSKCDLKVAPPELEALTHLQELSLAGNADLELAPVAGRRVPLPDSLTKLSLHNISRGPLPSGLAALSSLQDLDLSANWGVLLISPATADPLACLNVLSRLDLSGCGMALPPQLWEVPALKALTLRARVRGSDFDDDIRQFEHYDLLAGGVLSELGLEELDIDLPAAALVARELADMRTLRRLRLGLRQVDRLDNSKARPGNDLETTLAKVRRIVVLASRLPRLERLSFNMAVSSIRKNSKDGRWLLEQLERRCPHLEVAGTEGTGD